MCIRVGAYTTSRGDTTLHIYYTTRRGATDRIYMCVYTRTYVLILGESLKNHVVFSHSLRPNNYLSIYFVGPVRGYGQLQRCACFFYEPLLAVSNRRGLAEEHKSDTRIKMDGGIGDTKLRGSTMVYTVAAIKRHAGTHRGV